MAPLEENYAVKWFFPAEAAGGAAYLRAIHSPCSRSPLLPDRGHHAHECGRYLKSPNVGCVGGSWLTSVDAVESYDWARISNPAAIARELADPTAEPRPATSNHAKV